MVRAIIIVRYQIVDFFIFVLCGKVLAEGE